MWNKLFGQENIPEDWQTITTQTDLTNAIDASFRSPIAIFKHSTSCSRSAFAKHRLQGDHTTGNKKIKIYYLDLLAHRDLSNAVASKLQVTHQSPQFILLKDGKVIHHASHERIDLKRALKTVD